MKTHFPPLAQAAAPQPPAEPPHAERVVSCLGRTCLHWRADGELIEDDRDLVLERLRQVDGQLDSQVGPAQAA